MQKRTRMDDPDSGEKMKAKVKCKKPVKTKTLKEIHSYWKGRKSGKNSPGTYISGKERSLFLVELVKKHAQPDSSILEIGCNLGRNLNYLYTAGFKHLTGIEISENAVKALRKNFPELADSATIINSSVEEVIKSFEDNQFDLVFTMAVLEHIHPDSEWIFPEIVRITRGVLITIESEQFHNWRIFPRDYSNIFTRLKMKHLKTIKCTSVKGLGLYSAQIFRQE